MDQLSQRSSSERTQFMSREDLDQEGSLDLEHDHYHYHDDDQDQYIDQELERHGGQDPRTTRGAIVATPTKTLELKVQDARTQQMHRNVLLLQMFFYACKAVIPVFIELQPCQLTLTWELKY